MAELILFRHRARLLLRDVIERRVPDNADFAMLEAEARDQFRGLFRSSRRRLRKQQGHRDQRESGSRGFQQINHPSHRNTAV